VRRLQRRERLMPGVPAAVADGPWWWVWLFLLAVVFSRSQGTYWVGRWLRRGLTGRPDASVSVQDKPSERRARWARRFSGPGWERAENFLDRWGFIGIPVSFLTVGFQTMVLAAAGFGRMRWDLFTAAMIPGCAAWATIYTALGVGLAQAWTRSIWLFAGILVALVAAAWALTAIRRSRTSDSAVRTPR